MIVMFTSPAYSAVRGNNAPSKKYPEACRRLETSNVLSAAPAPKCKAHNSVFFLFFCFSFSFGTLLSGPTPAASHSSTHTPENAGTHGKMLVKGGNMAAARGYAGSPCKLLFLG